MNPLLLLIMYLWFVSFPSIRFNCRSFVRGGRDSNRCARTWRTLCVWNWGG